MQYLRHSAPGQQQVEAGSRLGAGWSTTLNNICHGACGQLRGSGVVLLVSQGPVTYTALVGGKHRTVQQSQII